jgi:hypothetical protein
MAYKLADLDEYGIILKDKQFVKRALATVKGAKKQKAVYDYVQIFIKKYHEEPVSHRKSNAARKAANTWIRETFLENETSSTPKQNK